MKMQKTKECSMYLNKPNQQERHQLKNTCLLLRKPQFSSILPPLRTQVQIRVSGQFAPQTIRPSDNSPGQLALNFQTIHPQCENTKVTDLQKKKRAQLLQLASQLNCSCQLWMKQDYHGQIYKSNKWQSHSLTSKTKELNTKHHLMLMRLTIRISFWFWLT